MTRLSLIAAFAIASAACTAVPDTMMASSTEAATPSTKKKKDTSAGNGTLGGKTAGSSETSSTAPNGACGKIDILFVIDDSGSMLDKQKKVAESLPTFIREIGETNGGTLDYRVAITTSSNTVVIDDKDFDGPNDSVAVDGKLVENTNCGMTRPWIERDDPNAESTFACAALVGGMGSSMEMPLNGMRNALTKAHASGEFLRDDALLAVVLFTDAGDSSSRKMHYATFDEYFNDQEDPAAYVSFLDQLKGSHERWAVATIAGDQKCTLDEETEDFEPRIQKLAEAAGKHGLNETMCQPSFDGTMTKILGTFQNACKDFPPVVK